VTTLADPILTPGTLAPGVTVAMLAKSGYTRTIRPNRIVSARMKLKAMKLYGIPRRRLFSYTGDHLIALENGGAPGSVTDLTNYWPQPKAEALLKDQQENTFHKCIVNGQLTIEEAAATVRLLWMSWP